MSISQPDITRAVLRSVHDFLGGPTSDGDEWYFDFGEHLHSNWGAVYGGALAAGALVVARSATTSARAALRRGGVRVVL